MKKVEIFIASSIDDLKADRDFLRAELGRLNDIYLRKREDIYFDFDFCEEQGGDIKLCGSQPPLDDLIRDSEITAVLFHNRIGGVTVHELKVALEQQSKTGKPDVYLFFSRSGRRDAAQEAQVREIAQQYSLAPQSFSDAQQIKDFLFAELQKRYPIE